jgi:hypothetical protein
MSKLGDHKYRMTVRGQRLTLGTQGTSAFATFGKCHVLSSRNFLAKNKITATR